MLRHDKAIKGGCVGMRQDNGWRTLLFNTMKFYCFSSNEFFSGTVTKVEVFDGVINDVLVVD